MWSWAPWGSELRITLLARTSSNLAFQVVNQMMMMMMMMVVVVAAVER
jgi:hypothetical protein